MQSLITPRIHKFYLSSGREEEIISKSFNEKIQIVVNKSCAKNQTATLPCPNNAQRNHFIVFIFTSIIEFLLIKISESS